ncbi:hypothetical protein [Conexibacter sp. SYSU D00693]|uniref:hypothetical protein n=1 Tax=Conexibacter sp. SYSU D00693 TaxID=2812560 RepID=UPI00196B3205|nr:hypothetical protein [Conexibacter sp. SYSU D00693]
MPSSLSARLSLFGAVIRLPAQLVLFLAHFPLTTIAGTRTTGFVVTESEDGLGYVLARDPLLDVMDADAWRELERRAVEGEPAL